MSFRHLPYNSNAENEMRIKEGLQLTKLIWDMSLKVRLSLLSIRPPEYSAIATIYNRLPRKTGDLVKFLYLLISGMITKRILIVGEDGVIQNGEKGTRCYSDLLTFSMLSCLCTSIVGSDKPFLINWTDKGNYRWVIRVYSHSKEHANNNFVLA